MTSSSTQDLIVDGAELSCPITIKRGKTARIYQVIAYPTQLTRKTTNGCLDGTAATPDTKAIRKCRWHTAGIIQFHINPETDMIYEARPDLHELEITLECFLEDSHKEQLAARAEEIYGCEFSIENFVICPFQTFMAQLTIRVSGNTKTFYGTLVDNKELHPMRVIFEIKDADELSEITSKLGHPRDHDIVLRYDYSLGGTSTARASLTISAEELNKINLEKQIFGNSKAEKMLVSRSFMDKITANVTTTLRVVEDIGVGGSSFGPDLIKQEIARAMSASGFEKFSLDDIKQIQSADTDITDDLKADIISSASASDSNSLASSHHNKEQSSSADSSNLLHEKSDSYRTAGGQSTSSSHSSEWDAKVGFKGFEIGGGQKSSDSSSQSTNFDNSNSSGRRDHEIVSTASSRLNEKSGSDSSSNSNSNTVQGQIRKTKNIDAAIVHRSEIAKGFTISLERWHHQLATTSIKGRLTTKIDIQLQEDVQTKDARKEEEERIAKTNAIRKERELTPEQIDELLHAVDSLDEEKLQEMHAKFLELCPDGKMTREVFSNAFRELFASGKTSNYCRYAFNIFDQDKNGTLNFTEYVMAMHIHESDDVEESLGLAFDVFDYDKSGEIDQKEILHMITATNELLSNPCDLPSAKVLAKKIIDSCDMNRKRTITREEFVNGCKNNKEYCRMILPNFERITETLDPNYNGELERGKRHGRGVYTWPDGRRYDGQWKDDVRHGHGIETLSDGERYEGEWKDDKKNGRGVRISPDGVRFDGEWKDDKKHGKGVCIWPDGRQYKGEWNNDKQNENGNYIWPDGRQYEGGMKGDLKHGYGVEILPDSDRYEGEWENDKKNGKGVRTWPNGDRYEGNWKVDKRTGKGAIKWKIGNQYEGDWNNDKRTGKGVFTGADGERYDGEYKDDSREGQGTCTFKSGNKYTGLWKNGKMNGKGTYTWLDGSHYTGNLSNGDFEGYGVRVYANGEKYDGQWKKDEKHGKGVLTLSNGNRFEGEWENGWRNPDGFLYCPSGTRWNGHLDDNLLKTAR